MTSYGFFFLSILCLFYHSVSLANNYGDTKLLKNYAQVRQLLKQEGFKEIYFQTPDKLWLNGLFLSRPNALCNVVVCAGWLPGRMEGMATFYSLLPQDCNILLFDARGHGKSKGPLFSKVWRYGIDEYKDIVGALACLQHINQLPVFLCGICSGAYNCARALIELKKHKMDHCYPVKGLIFDSGWGSVIKIASTIVISGVRARLFSCIKHFTKKYGALQNTVHRVGDGVMSFVRLVYGLFFNLALKPFMIWHTEKTDIFSKMHLISCPVFFIHSREDDYACRKGIMSLIGAVPFKKVWIVDDSYHAKNHLIHQQKYQHKVAVFIKRCLKL